MVDRNSTIRLVGGVEITVPMDIVKVREQLTRINTAEAAPFWKITDVEGETHLIALNNILDIRGIE